MRYSLGMALWLSYKPGETAQALGEFKAAIIFLKQREPTHHSLTAFEKAHEMAQESLKIFQEPGTRTTWPYWCPPTSTKYQGDTALTIPPFVRNAGRGNERIWGEEISTPQTTVIKW